MSSCGFTVHSLAHSSYKTLHVCGLQLLHYTALQTTLSHVIYILLVTVELHNIFTF